MQPRLESIKIGDLYSSVSAYRYRVSSFDHPWHYHPQYELTYIHSGHGMRYLGDHVEPFAAGDLILIGKNLPHQWVSSIFDVSDNLSHAEATVIHFSDDIIFDLPEFKAIKSLMIRASKGLKFNRGTQVILRLLESLTHNEPIGRLTNLIDILDKISQINNPMTLSSIGFDSYNLQNNHIDRISEVKSYLLGNLEKQISLDDMASRYNLTKPSFCRWFKKSMGISFVTFLNQLRIERACQLLIKTDETISQIAYQIGFESIANFNRFFKRIKNEPPRDYRKRKEFK